MIASTRRAGDLGHSLHADHLEISPTHSKKDAEMSLKERKRKRAREKHANLPEEKKEEKVMGLVTMIGYTEIISMCGSLWTGLKIHGMTRMVYFLRC
ncbi:hypothetical protein U9M48_029631 [Paspalum notatum var. saurae]|uniref:Uncharacterized protein n=1 Tax=Paspalum notatum var. saurae TaxID=547442 RepID=A0AAQ3TYA4_PASNO